MTQLVNARATFKDKTHFLNQHPELVEFSYLDDGTPLTAEHADKINKITEYYLNNDIYPVFIPEDRITDNNKSVIAEATFDLHKWTNEGLPKFNLKDIQTGKSIDGLSHAKGGRPAVNQSGG